MLAPRAAGRPAQPASYTTCYHTASARPAQWSSALPSAPPGTGSCRRRQHPRRRTPAGPRARYESHGCFSSSSAVGRSSGFACIAALRKSTQRSDRRLGKGSGTPLSSAARSCSRAAAGCGGRAGGVSGEAVCVLPKPAAAAQTLAAQRLSTAPLPAARRGVAGLQEGTGPQRQGRHKRQGRPTQQAARRALRLSSSFWKGAWPTIKSYAVAPRLHTSSCRGRRQRCNAAKFG
jgi:hypothetical protein